MGGGSELGRHFNAPSPHPPDDGAHGQNCLSPRPGTSSAEGAESPEKPILGAFWPMAHSACPSTPGHPKTPPPRFGQKSGWGEGMLCRRQNPRSSRLLPAVTRQSSCRTSTPDRQGLFLQRLVTRGWAPPRGGAERVLPQSVGSAFFGIYLKQISVEESFAGQISAMAYARYEMDDE